MQAIGVIGILGMLGSVGASGYNANKSAGQLRESIEEMTKKIEKYKQGYDDLLTSQAKLGLDIVDAMNEDIDQITQLSKAIDIEKQNHARTYREIQLAGVTVIIYIAFIFILKIFGFYDVVQEVLSYPIRKVFGMGENGTEKKENK